MIAKRSFCFVFARGGSKGIPKKNIRKLVDRPLIAHSIAIAKEINLIERVFVSTDSPEIASVANSYGAQVIPRPSEIAQDSSDEWTAWRHSVEWVRNHIGDFDRFISLPATAPLRSQDDVIRTINALDDLSDIVITMTNAHRSPWFNMVTFDRNNYVNLVLRPANKIYRRQDSPVSFDMTTVAYVTRPDFILENNSIWDGRVRGVLIPKERSIDIDTQFDFDIAEYLLNKRINK